MSAPREIEKFVMVFPLPTISGENPLAPKPVLPTVPIPKPRKGAEETLIALSCQVWSPALNARRSDVPAPGAKLPVTPTVGEGV